jgi:hypothetical protein
VSSAIMDPVMGRLSGGGVGAIAKRLGVESNEAIASLFRKRAADRSGPATAGTAGQEGRLLVCLRSRLSSSRSLRIRRLRRR